MTKMTVEAEKIEDVRFLYSIALQVEKLLEEKNKAESLTYLKGSLEKRKNWGPFCFSWDHRVVVFEGTFLPLTKEFIREMTELSRQEQELQFVALWLAEKESVERLQKSNKGISDEVQIYWQKDSRRTVSAGSQLLEDRAVGTLADKIIASIALVIKVKENFLAKQQKELRRCRRIYEEIIL